MAILTVHKEFYTYLHTKPNGDIFYVGKGSGKRSHNFVKRCAHHKNIVAKYGKENIGIFVFPCESEKEAFNNEIKQIAQLRRDGFKLVNSTDGGDGPSGYKHTKTALAKMSEKLKGTTRRIGKKHTPESLAKMSATHKRISQTPEERKRLSDIRIGTECPMKGKKHSPESIAKMKASHKGKIISDATKIKLSAAAKAQWSNPEKQPNRRRISSLS